MLKRQNSKLQTIRGFTLIELLVVISIIGTLSTVAMTSLNGARAKARDARRLLDMEQIKNALEIYYAQYGKYPDNTDSGDPSCWGSWDAGNSLNASDSFLSPLVSSGILAQVPLETHTVEDYRCSYRYWKQASNACDCPDRYAVLYAILETSSAPQDERPDCIKSCWSEGISSRDYAVYLPY